jgi:NAD(P)-dependent dehydrogenase (short-subunit alcohol dehydrogenase family)
MANPLKSCLITGCSEGGAGAALAEAFAKKGYHVFATARSPSKVPRSLHDASNVTVLALDVASSESIASAAEEVREKTAGKLDVLINNAGMGLSAPGLDTPMSDARKVFDINFFGVLEMIQVFSPLLVEAKGFIINNSSVGGHLPLPFLSMCLVDLCTYQSLENLERRV